MSDPRRRTARAGDPGPEPAAPLPAASGNGGFLLRAAAAVAERLPRQRLRPVGDTATPDPLPTKGGRRRRAWSGKTGHRVRDRWLEVGERLISPLVVGEMPGRAEGGAVPPASPGNVEKPDCSRAGFGLRPGIQVDDFWLDIRKRLMALPQMRAAEAGFPSTVFGRRPAARKPRVSVPALGSGRLVGRLPVISNGLSRIVRISAPKGHDLFIAAALLAFFTLGWLAALACAA